MYVYGKNVVKETLNQNKKINKVFVNKNFNDKEILTKLKQLKVKINYTNNIDLDNKSDNGLHQGIVLQIDDIATYDYNEIIPNIKKEYKTVVMLDHIEDPHNFGAIIRTSYALGVDAIIIPNDRNANITPIVVKTSAGAINHLPIIRVPNLSSTITKLKKDGFWIIGTDMQGTSHTKMDYKIHICLIIGNEGKGMSNILKKECDYIATINMQNNFNSLNASVSCGIILAEMNRNRYDK